MYDRIMLTVGALSGLTTAVFCMWIAVNMVTCSREIDKEVTQSSLGRPTSEAEMARERAEIERQLKVRAMLPDLPEFPKMPALPK